MLCPTFTGLQKLWDDGSWQLLLGPAGLAGASEGTCPLLVAPQCGPEAMAAPGAGARRGLLEALLALSMPQEVGRRLARARARTHACTLNHKRGQS
jgi:hypothetical protein